MNIPGPATIAVAVAAGVAALVSYDVMDDTEPPLDIMSIELVKTSVPQGGVVTVEWDFFRTAICRTKIDYTIVNADDAEILNVSIEREVFGPIEPVHKLRQLRLPKDIASGTARVFPTGIFRCNIYQKYGLIAPIIVHYDPLSFEITKSHEGGRSG